MENLQGNKMWNRLHTSLRVAAMLSAFLPATLMAIEFVDGEFVDGDWTLSTQVFLNGGTVIAVRDYGTGPYGPGNPGAFRYIENSVNSGATSHVWGFHFKIGAVYDPIQHGPIGCINYSEDQIMFDGFGLGQAGGLAIEQSGKQFVVSGPLTLFANQGPDVIPQPTWTNATQPRPVDFRPGLNVYDFRLLENGELEAPVVTRPDFSGSGAPITFGFYRRNQSAGDPYTIKGGIDNWRVEILPQCLIRVDIDIKPGSDPNCFNVNGSGVIPVAILGTADLDVSAINLDTLSFGALQVRMRGNKGPLCSTEDINGDGYDDLVCKFEDDGVTNWEPTGDEATLVGTLLNGTPIEGTDTICVNP